jgi:ribosomal protein L29
MKQNDVRALHDKTIAELQQQLIELQKERTKARLELSVGKLADVKQTSKIGDDMARVKTVISQKERTQE